MTSILASVAWWALIGVVAILAGGFIGMALYHLIHGDDHE